MSSSSEQSALASGFSAPLLSAAAVVLAYFLYTKFSQSARVRKAVPGPSFSLLKITDFTPFTAPLPHEDLLPPSAKASYGGIFGVWIGTQRMIFINDVDIALEMLVTKGTDFANRPHTNSCEYYEYMWEQSFVAYFVGWKSFSMAKYAVVLCMWYFVCGHVV